MQRRITDNIQDLIAILPVHIGQTLQEFNDHDHLFEVVLDLGRFPKARYTYGERLLAQHELGREDLNYVVGRINGFNSDNRAGLPRTLHRISCIRNRQGEIVGLTCRVGRAVWGTIDCVQDVFERGESILLLGRPAVGKTTLLREAARVLAERRRVVIVDTSSEIGGDGDVPHVGVGEARRMQVSNPAAQHKVMIEAVENHNPEVVVVDEIGNEAEAAAARTIAERGVQLIATAHGHTLANLLANPTLADLAGGIEDVTLSDEEAHRRGTQKVVLERRAPATFKVLIEIQDREKLALYLDVDRAVDAYLRGLPLVPEIRHFDPAGQIQTAETGAAPTQPGKRADEAWGLPGARSGRIHSMTLAPMGQQALRETRLYLADIDTQVFEQVVRRMRVPVRVMADLESADMLVIPKAKRKKSPHVYDAERLDKPVGVLRSESEQHIERFLCEMLNLPLLEYGSD